MPEKIVKRVRRDDEEHYDVVRNARGKLERRPLDAATPQPTASDEEPVGKSSQPDTSALAHTTEE